MRAVWLALLLAATPALGAAELLSHREVDGALVLSTTDGEVELRFHGPDAVEAHYRRNGDAQPDSYSLTGQAGPVSARVVESADGLEYRSDRLVAHVQSSPLRIRYSYDGEPLLAEEHGFFHTPTMRGFRFGLADDEKLMGTGQRVLGMDRRGHRLPLYNRPAYGYGDSAEQMYFSLPAVLSNRGYLLLFDNAASGHVDMGHSQPGVLQFEAVAGRTAYVVVAGDSYPAIIANYVAATGHPPLAARWTLGNYASRFGYRSEAEARDVVRRFRDADVPLDAIVLDLYWFGPDIQGHMGNLDWDRDAFPTPEAMMADFAADGVHTILVTEPFVLTSSTRWAEAVREGVLARNLAGQPRVFDFYFGNTGLIDVFDAGARAWFWGIYEGLTRQGVGGWWGDLGEPEVHPADTVHAAGMADEIHNVYGHEWARLVYEGHVAAFPERRPFVMMRAGAPGSQRYGMVPWTGDVERSWAGLGSQVELALQMGLFGFGWIHSDLGGFAGGESFDAELYTRWLQYGVFQPVFRPHAQEHIAPEPVFHDATTLARARDAIRLRYRLLPYNYTLAHEHARTGMPLMRPLFFLDEDDPALVDRHDAFLWGDAFLVAPVVAPGLASLEVDLPEGHWYDFHSGAAVEGGRVHRFELSPDALPVLVRAGAFVPMYEPAASTAAIDRSRLVVHHWVDPAGRPSEGSMYDDDGLTRGAEASGASETIRFRAEPGSGNHRFGFGVQGGEYPGRPGSRSLVLQLHGVDTPPTRVLVGPDRSPLDTGRVRHRADSQRLEIDIGALHDGLELTVEWSAGG